MRKRIFCLVSIYNQAKVGTTFVLLQGDRIVCRKRECNMGNLVADAIVAQNQQFGYGDQWASVTLGFWNGGGIRSSIEKNATGLY